MDHEQTQEMSFPLLENGLDFVVSALEHLTGETETRDLKYAVIHLAAGIDLVLKERLRREHWTLVFDKPKKADRKASKWGTFTASSWTVALTG